MVPNRVIEVTLRQAQHILWAGLQPGRSSESTLTDLRSLLLSPTVNSSMSGASDALPLFAVREAQLAVSSDSRTSQATIDLLWSILDDPWLDTALGAPNSKRRIGRILRRH
jgi:hypothetical protein